MPKGLYILDDVFKGIRVAGGTPFFSGAKGKAKGEFGGLYVGGSKGKTSYGPKGGHIKKISPTTGKPIYYKKYEEKRSVKVAPPTEF